MGAFVPDSNKEAVQVVVTVLEPDDAVRREIEAIVETVEDWRRVGPRVRSPSLSSAEPAQDPLRVTILGPHVSERVIERETKSDQAVVVLNEPSELDRRLEAYRLGVDEVLVWPLQRRELVTRLGFVVQRRHDLRSRLIDRRDLDALLDLSESLMGARDIEDSLHEISSRMAEVMSSERCSIIVLDEDERYGYVVAASDDATVRRLRIPVAEGYPEIQEVVRTASPLVIDDVEHDPIFDEIRDKLRGKSLGNTALFPVLLEGRVQGVLHLRGADVRKRELSKRQLRFGTIIANVVAIALRNARTYQHIRARAERVASARVKAEQKIRDLQKYQRFFDLSGDGIVIVDGRGNILFANREAQSILGFSSQDITRLAFRDLVAPNARGVLDELLTGFAAGRHRRHLDLAIVRSSGEVAVLSLSTASLDSESDGAEVPSAEVATIVSIRDVTETRRIETELRKTTEFLQNLIESSADAIIASDIRGRILIFNGGAERITGYTRAEAVGKLNAAALYEAGVAQRIMQRLRADENGRFYAAREALLSKTGERIPIGIRAALIFDKGREVATVGIFSDLRQQIDMEERLSAAQKRLEITERQAGAVEVAGAAAHELSQPLTAIVGSAELLLRKVDADSPLRRSLERVLSESERMAGILKQISQITKYRTKPYLGDTQIVDLEASSGGEEEPI